MTNAVIATNFQPYAEFYINGELKMARLLYHRSELSVNANGATSNLNIPNEYCPKGNLPHGIRDNVRMTLLFDTGNIKFDNYTSNNITVTFAHQWDYSYA